MRCSASNPGKLRKAQKPRQTLAELDALQRLTAKVIMRDLSPNDAMQTTWEDGRATQEVVSQFIAPNDRLSSFERLEIYNKQYWFRLIDSIYDDFPGLLMILGQDKFSQLARAYVGAYPSRSFTLRNLGSRLAEFIKAQPKCAAPHEQMAIDMARFEWAQIHAFDGPALPPLSAADLAGKNPLKLKLALQPYLVLLDLAYPLDDFSLAMKTQTLRGEASNAMDQNALPRAKTRAVRPRRKQVFVAVHRLENDLYYKRLDPAAYRLLTALDSGKSLGAACKAVGADVSQATLGEWFAQWMSLGWFCKRP